METPHLKSSLKTKEDFAILTKLWPIFRDTMKEEEEQRIELSVRITEQLFSELSASSKAACRSRQRQTRLYVEVLLKVAQRLGSLWFLALEAEGQDHSRNIKEPLKFWVTLEEAEYLDFLAKECGYSKSKLIRLLFRTALKMEKALALPGHLLGKGDFARLILEELTLRSSRVQ